MNMWLPGLGSNQGPQLQRLLCYHYTTGHWGLGQSVVPRSALGIYSRPPVPLQSRGTAWATMV